MSDVTAMPSDQPSDQPSACQMTISKGKRKGLPCDRVTLSPDEAYCKFHAVKNTPVRTCSMILTKGVRKTLTCNKRVTSTEHDLCTLHWLRECRRPGNPYIEHEKDIQVIQLSPEKGTISSETAVVELSQLNPGLAARLIALTGN